MPLMTAQEADFGQTPSQTVGPYFAYGLTATQYGYDFDQPFDAVVALATAGGERIRLEGRVIDGDGNPISDALVEISQPDGEGRYRFLTIKPGAYPWGNHPNAWRPQHIHLSLFGQSFASRLVTQMYFPGDPLMQYDPMITGTPERYRNRLVADFSLDITEEGYALGYQFDIVLRGADETPFENR